jgi:acetolactate synthase-1/2/3 large subunit
VLIRRRSKLVYPGGAIMPVYDELYKFKDELQHVVPQRTSNSCCTRICKSNRSKIATLQVLEHKPSNRNCWCTNWFYMVCITGQVGKHLLDLMPFRERYYWDFNSCNQMELSDYRSFWDTWNNGKGFYIARSGRPGPVLDITKKCNLMNLSSV